MKYIKYVLLIVLIIAFIIVCNQKEETVPFQYIPDKILVDSVKNDTTNIDTVIEHKKINKKHINKVQMTTDGYLVDEKNEVENSQGFYNIGKVCLNKFNKKTK